MKLLIRTHRHGKRASVYISYEGRAYFADPQPQPDQLIVLDLPGLEEASFKSVVKWLKRNAPAASDAPPLTSRRELARFSPEHWRVAVPDDVLDSEGWEVVRYGAVDAFTVEQLRDYCDRHHAEIQQRLQAIQWIPPGEERVAALQSAAAWASRVFSVIQLVDDRLGHEWNLARQQLDQQLWQQLRDDAGLALPNLIAAVAKIATQEVRQKGLYAIADRLAKQDFTDSQRRDLLRLMYAQDTLKSLFTWDDRFWRKIRDVFPMPQPERGVTVDLTEARPVKVTEQMDLLNARIVGPVKLGRPALGVYTRKGWEFLVAGKRSLLFRITDAGGSLEKYGCRLTIEMKSKASLHPRLMEVERLATLAQVDPAAAVASVADMHLPSDHLIYRTAAAAQRDPAQANLLADLLIELKFSIDPDVARHLARMRASEPGC
jgi:hypothetical protein